MSLRAPVLLLACLLLPLAGCAAPAHLASLPEASPLPSPAPKVTTGTMSIGRDVGAGGCTGLGLDPHDQSYNRTTVSVALPDGARRLSIDVVWTPVNPTAQRLNFTLWRDVGPGEQAVAFTASASPLHWVFTGPDLAGLPREPILIASGDACAAPGLYAAAIVDQALQYRIEVLG